MNYEHIKLWQICVTTVCLTILLLAFQCTFCYGLLLKKCQNEINNKGLPTYCTVGTTTRKATNFVGNSIVSCLADLTVDSLPYCRTNNTVTTKRSGTTDTLPYCTVRCTKHSRIEEAGVIKYGYDMLQVLKLNKPG